MYEKIDIDAKPKSHSYLTNRQGPTSFKAVLKVDKFYENPLQNPSMLKYYHPKGYRWEYRPHIKSCRCLVGPSFSFLTVSTKNYPP